MALIGQMKLADFCLKLYRGDLERLCGYEYVPQKKEYIPGTEKSDPLPRSTPEAQGVPSKLVEQFLRDLAALKGADTHSVVILRHGVQIAQAHFKPYRGDYPHILYSLSKTVTATAVGFAVQEGLLSLDDRLVDLFSDKALPIPLRNGRLNALTIRHLLTMQSGVKFNELGSVLERDWAKGFLQSEFAFEPGSRFSYNSMNSYMLSAAVCRKAGMGLVEYLAPRLFAPLGIRGVQWETCPNGIEKGGWGLMLRPEDMAKLGLLYLQKGCYSVDGRMRRLLSVDWVRQATANQTGCCEGAPHGYGFHIWLCKRPGVYNFNGMFGQYVIVLPKSDMVVAITGGSRNLMPESGTLGLVQDTFGGRELLSAGPLPKDIRALKSMVRTMQGLTLLKKEVLPRRTPASLFRRLAGRKKEPTNAERRYNGTQYSLSKSFGSLLPLILQCVHNNFTGGLQKIGFAFQPGEGLITVTEHDTLYVIPAGTDGVPRYTNITINGEPYNLGSYARWTTDEDDRDVLKLYLSFVETPDTRIIKCIFEDGGKLTVKFDERPSASLAFQMMTDSFQLDLHINDYISHRLHKLLLPVAEGVKE